MSDDYFSAEQRAGCILLPGQALADDPPREKKSVAASPRTEQSTSLGGSTNLHDDPGEFPSVTIDEYRRIQEAIASYKHKYMDSVDFHMNVIQPIVTELLLKYELDPEYISFDTWFGKFFRIDDPESLS